MKALLQNTPLLRRIILTLFALAIPPLVGLLLTYQVISVEWISFMEIQPSYRSMEDPLPLPKGSVPIQGAAYVPGNGAPTNPVPADALSLERGAALYSVHCALCHGEAGLGDGSVAEKLSRKPANLTAPNAMQLEDGAIYLIISDGVKNLMPALRENLSVRERWDVVNYVRTLQQKP